MTTSIANSLGFGSGIDTAKLVSDLAAASSQPKLDRIKTLTNANQAKVSALGQARSDLESFASSLSNLVAGGSLRTQPTSSNTAAIEAKALSGSLLGGLTASVVVNQLARAQTLYAPYQSSASAAVGQGMLTLDIGGRTHEIAISASNNSLTGLRDAVNATGSGVTASIVSDSAGSRLVMKGATGVINEFSLSASADSDPALSRFTYGGGTSGMTIGQSAQDALFSIDGINMSRTTNTISDAVPGVELTLKQANATMPVALGASRPTDALRQTLNDFVSAFNTLKADIGKARTANSGGQALVGLERELNGLLNRAVTSHSTVNSLNDIGIATNRDGTIRLDQTRLDQVITSNPDEVEAIFNPLRDATHSESTDPGISHAMSSLAQKMTAPDGVLEVLGARLKRESDALTASRTDIETRAETYRKRLEKQYSVMDSRIGALKATQSYLDQQIQLWSNQSR
jgi:flagellar hook-associated protein 2